MDGARSPAPDLFTALAWGSRLAPELPDDPPVDPDRPTAPELPIIGGPLPRLRPNAVVVDPALAAVTVAPGTPGFTPLADLLEPGAIASQPLDASEFEDLVEVLDEPTNVPPRPLPRRPTPVAFPRPAGGVVPVVERRPAAAPMFPAPGDAADSAQFMSAAMSGTTPMVSRVAPLVELDIDEPVRSRGGAWAWVALSLMLAGTLGWVLYTQTDLFSGDVIANRDAAQPCEQVLAGLVGLTASVS